MAVSNFAACDKKRAKYEGGMSRDPNDPGNWTGGKVGVGNLLGTKYGIAANTYPDIDIPNLTEAQAAALFKRDYWDKVAGDLMPVGVDLCMYDTAVHSGPGRSKQFLQSMLAKDGAFPFLARLSSARGDYIDQVKQLCALRMSFLRQLKIWSRYSKGFTSRVADVEATGVKMVLAAGNNSPEVIKKKLEQEAADAATKSKNSAKGAGTAVVVEGAKNTGTTQVDVSTFDWSAWVGFGLVSLVLIVLVIVFLVKWNQHRERAKAYAAVAKEA